MIAFAALIEALAFARTDRHRRVLLAEYFSVAPDADREWAAAIITGATTFGRIKPAMLRSLALDRVDEELFALSHGFVGDLVETTALIWPEADAAPRNPRLAEVVDGLSRATKIDAPGVVADLLDDISASARFVFLKLATGGLRAGVTPRLLCQALADHAGKDAAEIEEVWHGLSQPSERLFRWLDGAERPRPDIIAAFRPTMDAREIEFRDVEGRDAAAYSATWKHDGLRVQAVSEDGVRRIFTTSGEDISRAFPDMVAALGFDGVVDGELSVRRTNGEVGDYGDLQLRLKRKRPGKDLIASAPAVLHADDLLFSTGEDLRPLAAETRRARLTDLVDNLASDHLRLAEEIDFADWKDLDARRAAPPHSAVDGVLIREKAAYYLAGDTDGRFLAWRVDPHEITAVLMYAQRGAGDLASHFAECSFGVWDENGALTPIGKAELALESEDLKKVDAYVRANTTERFGPVRAVVADADKGLVFRIAFMGASPSKRRKSGLALRGPRANALCSELRPADASGISDLTAMMSARTAP